MTKPWALAEKEPTYVPPPFDDDPGRFDSLFGGTAAVTQAAAPAKLRDRLLFRHALADLPQPEPLIWDTLDRRTVTLLEGRNSTGKSFLALDWSCCIATGRPWQGRHAETGRVLYIAAEGAHGLHQRVSAWEYAWREQVPDAALVIVPFPINLFSGKHYDELLAVITDDQQDDQPFALVVVDTWARSTVGGKENDNSDSTVAFERLDRIRATGATVLVVHHTDKADTSGRGASALEDNADGIYRIKGDEGLLELTREKRKDGPAEDRHQLQLKVIDFGESSSCVIENTRGHIGALTDRATDLLSVHRTHFADIGCTKSDLRAIAQMAPATFARGLKTLTDQGFLINTGTDQRPYYKPGANYAN